MKTQESAIFSRLCCIGYTESFWDSEPSSESKSITFFSSKSHPHQQTFSFSNLRPYCTVVFQLKTYSLHNHFYAWGFIRDVFSQVSFEIREKMKMCTDVLNFQSNPAIFMSVAIKLLAKHFAGRKDFDAAVRIGDFVSLQVLYKDVASNRALFPD